MAITLFIIGLIAFVAFIIYCCTKHNHADDFNELFDEPEVESQTMPSSASDSSKHYEAGKVYNYRTRMFDNGHDPAGDYDVD